MELHSLNSSLTGIDTLGNLETNSHSLSVFSPFISLGMSICLLFFELLIVLNSPELVNTMFLLKIILSICSFKLVLYSESCTLSNLHILKIFRFSFFLNYSVIGHRIITFLLLFHCSFYLPQESHSDLFLH